MPDRADLDAALKRFHDAGLTPVLRTYGTDVHGDLVNVSPDAHDADVELTLGRRVPGQGAPILSVVVTDAGQARLDRAPKPA